MKVCLIRPPRLQDRETISLRPTPPLGLAFIAGALAEAGYEVIAIDAIGESPEQFNPIEFTPNTSKPAEMVTRMVTNGLTSDEIVALIPADVKIIGLSCMFSDNWMADRYLIDFLKGKFPQAVIIAGGESISSIPELCIQQTRHLDVCVLGEGEETVVALARAIENNEDITGIAGIVYRQKETNQAIATPRRNRVRDIEQIPWPAWELFPLQNYIKYKLQFGITERNSLPIMATRGCPYSCTFCSSPAMWGTRYYMRSPKDVVDEMEFLMKQYDVTSFDFYDLTAIIKKDWIIDFTNEVLNRKLDIRWQLPVGTRSEAIDEEVTNQLYLSGCTNITYAPESGSTRMLKLIKKKVKIPNMMASMRAAHKANLYIYINMILALPEETHLDVWKTFWFLIKCSWVGVNDIGPGLFLPYPGSQYFKNFVADKTIDLSNDDFFMDLVFVFSYGKTKYYNNNVHRNWYLFYEVLMVGFFFGSNYLFRPWRIIRTIRNMISEKYESRAERALALYLKRKAAAIKPKSTPVLQGETVEA